LRGLVLNCCARVLRGVLEGKFCLREEFLHSTRIYFVKFSRLEKERRDLQMLWGH
jgi:hypothetical protein